MTPQTGSVVYIDGNRAALVIGPEQDENGAATGRFFVGTFANVETVEQGDYGASPGPAPDRSAIARGQAGPGVAAPSTAPIAPVAVLDTPGVQVGAVNGPDPQASPAVDARTQLDTLRSEGIIDEAGYNSAISHLESQGTTDPSPKQAA